MACEISVDIAALPLPRSFIARLDAVGYRKRSDLDGVHAASLALKLGIGEGEAAKLLANVRSGGSSTDELGANFLRSSARTGLAHLQEERAMFRIVTLVQRLDELLGGGIRPCQLTEVAGVPGVGKTQFGMQLSVNTAIPHALGGCGGETVYIDSEGSFSAQRTAQMAEGLISSLWQRLSACNPAERTQREAALRSLTSESILCGIHVFRCHDLAELAAVVKGLRDFAAGRNSRVRLVVVDSVAFHFRHEQLSYTRRLQMLGSVSQALLDFARAERAAAVLINQVIKQHAYHMRGEGREKREAWVAHTLTCRRCVKGTALAGGLRALARASACPYTRSLTRPPVDSQVTTRVNDATNESFIAPALGESWAHTCHSKLMLEWRQRVRTARLYKGGAPGSVAYQVVQEGVRPVSTVVRSSLDRLDEELVQAHECQWQAPSDAASWVAEQHPHGRACIKY
jgi:RAD51-like protein 2